MKNSVTKTNMKIIVPAGGTCMQASNKLTAQQCCIADEMNDDDARRPYMSVSRAISGQCKRACCSKHSVQRDFKDEDCFRSGFVLVCETQNKTKNPKDPMHPNCLIFLTFLFTVFSEIAHSIIAQEIQHPHQQQRAPRRVSKTCSMVWGGFWGFLFRALLFLWLVLVR